MSAHRARPLPSDWMHRHQWVSPRGRPAWPARRCSPEVQPFGGCSCSAGHEGCNCGLFAGVGQDRMPESFDADDGQPLTAREALIFWLSVCAPSIGGVALLALILWMTKP